MWGSRSRVWLIDMTLKDATLKGKKGTNGYLCQGENHSLFIHYPFVINSNAFKKLFKVFDCLLKRLNICPQYIWQALILLMRIEEWAFRGIIKKNYFYICMRKFSEHTWNVCFVVQTNNNYLLDFFGLPLQFNLSISFTHTYSEQMLPFSISGPWAKQQK